jgi:hypothetical protein
MATNLSLDPKLLEQAVKVSGERTKKAAVTRALEEFIARRNQKHLLDLMGKLEWDTGGDAIVTTGLGAAETVAGLCRPSCPQGHRAAIRRPAAPGAGSVGPH